MPSSYNPPSLFARSRPVQPTGATAAPVRSAPLQARTLFDLMYDGFYTLFLLKNGWTPGAGDGGETFRARLRDFLASVDRGGQRLGAPAEDIYDAKHAFCALMDERVLSAGGPLVAEWQRNPLQLEMFGDQLAGESFFDRLEELRAQGAAKVQVLEVFHMCLLLGFQGKYISEGREKLGYLTARLGDEIAGHKGRRAAFAPHAAAPDHVAHKLRAKVPLWVMASVLALAALLAFLGLRLLLERQTSSQLAPYAQLIKMPAQAANVKITLP